MLSLLILNPEFAESGIAALLKLHEFGVRDVYVICLHERGQGLPALSEKGETYSLAEKKIWAIRNAEKIIDDVEKSGLNVTGLSISFGNAIEELLHVAESFSPEVIVAVVKNVDEILKGVYNLDVATMIIKQKDIGDLFEKTIYVHAAGCEWGFEKFAVNKIYGLGVVEPTLPPESSSRIMEERKKVLKYELNRIRDLLRERNIEFENEVVTGSISDVAKIAEEKEATLVIVSRGHGINRIGRVAKILEKPLMIV